MRWLFVEDEPGLYETLLAIAELVGERGVAFTDGDDATAWIATVECRGNMIEPSPQLALLDMQLPGKLSGIEVAARLRESAVFGDTRIVLFTSHHLTPVEYDEVMTLSKADLILYKPLPQQDRFQTLIEMVLYSNRTEKAG